MESTYVVVAFTTAGIALLAGITHISTGLRRETGRAELIFGLQALCLFIFLILPPAGFILNDKAPYPRTIVVKRIFIWGYYFLLVHFIRSYSGYRNRLLLYVIYLFWASSYMMMALTKQDSNNPYWGTVAEISMGLILFYGLAAARYQIRHDQKKDGKWLLAAMALYGFMYIFSVPYWIISLKSVFPFHINVLAFLTIMTIRMRVDSLERYRLEKELRWQDVKWNLLVQNMQLMIMELDTQAIVKYINPYAVKILGYSGQNDLLGKNWFETSAVKEEITLRKEIFQDSIADEKLLTNVTSHIRTRNNQKLVISWTNVILMNPNKTVKGVLSIGIDNTELANAFEQVQHLKNELEKENLALKSESGSQISDHNIIGESQSILYAIQKSKQVAPTHAGVLLLGETGSGKELFANLIHDKSYRCLKPFVKVNCAALPSELIESELFGHEKGSFTNAYTSRKGKFELADGGTIFLDEIGELPLALQAKLLRVLQSNEFERIGGQQVMKVNVRVIAATNKNLSEEVKAGRFREDLYYRLNVFPITIPPLRQRKEDIPMLAAHFVSKFSAEEHKNITQISKADMSRLCTYSWPGNVRELINVLERSIIQTEGATLNLNWQQDNLQMQPELDMSSLCEIEKAHILKVLHESNWKINGIEGAAGKLGLHPNTLRSRLKKLQIVRGGNA